MSLRFTPSSGFQVSTCLASERSLPARGSEDAGTGGAGGRNAQDFTVRFAQTEL